jgi:hypothetical protein
MNIGIDAACFDHIMSVAFVFHMTHMFLEQMTPLA